MSQKVARQKQILELLAQNKELSVAELSMDLGVSGVTIRSNLRELEQGGMLARTHGGAQASSFQPTFERQQVRAAEKARIGRAAARLVRDNDSLLIDAGTTTALLFHSLGGKRGLQVVSNSTLAVPAARVESRIQTDPEWGSAPP